MLFQNDETALYAASIKGFVDLVRVLLDAGADPDIKTNVLHIHRWHVLLQTFLL